MADHLSGASLALNFLTDAGHALAMLAPETSAHLMSQRNALMLTHDLALSDVQRQHVCSSCGHLMLLGHGSIMKLENSRLTRRKTVARKQPHRKAMAPEARRREPQRGPKKVITCEACARWTSIQLPPPPPAPGHRTRKAGLARNNGSLKGSSGGGVTPAHANLPAPPSGPAAGKQPEKQKRTQANSSSRKRAKSRKAGLQALLDQTKSSANTTARGTLSLANFFTAGR